MGTRHAAFAPESTWNTPVAPSASVGVFFEATSEGLQMEKAEALVKTIRSASIRERYVATKAVRGTVTGALNYQEIGEALYYLIGDVDTTGVGPYTHTIPGSTGIANRPSFTTELQRDSTANTWRYAGCMMKGITITQSVSGDGSVTYDILGASQADGTAATASFRDLDIMKPSQWTVSFDGGSTTFCVRDLTLSMDFPLDEDFCLGATAMSTQPESSDTLNITGEVTAVFADQGEYDANYATDDTVSDIQIIATNATESMTINMNKTLVTQATPHMTGRERLTAKYVWGAYFDTTATDAMQVVLINDHDIITD